MTGFRPTDREPDAEPEKEIKNEVAYGHTDSGDPDRQERVNFDLFDETKVFAAKPLDKFLELKNPKIDQLQFIGTNLYNQFDYPIPLNPIGNLMKNPKFGMPSQPIFGDQPLFADPFTWSSPLAFEDERYGITHNFSQPKTPLVYSFK
jgi:hypothetical protein